MKKFIYLSIGIASLSLVSFREQEGNSLKPVTISPQENKTSTITNYVKFDHTDNSLGNPTTPPRD
ncbi:hypothetical protein SAMN05443292_0764 [Halpernia frigidisoli]|uniref:Uncharacterized protein n=1 Tax=Halpernia frigidisoli TaxID=1125876 RepID=A0A1I3DYL0_9FLAO|nr:hypothetical protein SAMN05443292_0764 [Halpernia frigidisoli]